MTSGTRARGPRQRPADRCLWGRRTPMHRGARPRPERLRVFSVARLSRALQGMDRHAELQELRSMWKHPRARTSSCLVRETK